MDDFDVVGGVDSPSSIGNKPSVYEQEEEEAEYTPIQTGELPSAEDFVVTQQVKDERSYNQRRMDMEENYDIYGSLLELDNVEAKELFLDVATDEQRQGYWDAVAMDKEKLEQTQKGFETGQTITDMMFGNKEGTYGLGVSPALEGIVAPLKLGVQPVKAAKYGGLSDEIYETISEGDIAQNAQMLRQAEVSKEMGVGGMPFIGDDISPTITDVTGNTFAQRDAAKRVRRAPYKAAEMAEGIIGRNQPLSKTATALDSALAAHSDSLYAPSQRLYDEALKSSDTRRLFDMKDVKEEVTEYMISQGAPDSEIKAAIKMLEPSGRAYTRAQKQAKADIPKLQKRIKKIQAELADNPGKKKSYLTNQLNQSKRKLKEARDVYTGETEFMSEMEIVNAIKQFGTKARQSGMSFTKTDDTTRILNNVKNMFMDRAEAMLEARGSKGIENLRKANKAYKEYTTFRDMTPEVNMMLDKSTEPFMKEEVAKYLMTNPTRLKGIIGKLKDPEIKKTMANEMVAQLARPVEQIKVGGIPKLDMAKTSKQLDNLITDKETAAFLQESLGEARFNELKAFQVVTNKMASIENSLADLPPTAWEYIKSGKGAIGKLGNVLETAYDAVGYLKNNIVPFSSRLPIAKDKLAYVERMADRVEKITTDKILELKGFGIKNYEDEGARALLQFSDSEAEEIARFQAVIKGLSESSQSAISQVTSTYMRPGQIGGNIPEPKSVQNIFKGMEGDKHANDVIQLVSRGQNVKHLPKESRQKAVNSILSTKLEGPDAGMGSISYTKPSEVGYRGFTITAKPGDFGNLAAKGNIDTSSIREGVQAGNKIGEPYLRAKYNPETNTVFVDGHEGRHRMKYIQETFGDDVEVPIHIGTLNRADEAGEIVGEMRNRAIPKDILGPDTKWVNENGEDISREISDQFKYNLYQAIGTVGVGGAASQVEAATQPGPPEAKNYSLFGNPKPTYDVEPQMGEPYDPMKQPRTDVDFARAENLVKANQAGVSQGTYMMMLDSYAKNPQKIHTDLAEARMVRDSMIQSGQVDKARRVEKSIKALEEIQNALGAYNGR